MNRERVLVALVLADIVLAFSVIGSELFFGWTLPGALRDYGMNQTIGIWSGAGAVRVALWALTVSATIVAWIGLLNLWWFARRLYAGAWVTWVLLIVCSGPSVMTPLGAMFDTVEAVVGGAILGLIYFSDLSRHFERRAVVEARATV